MWANIIAAVVVIGIVGGAVAYMVRSKKKGAHCIGCPYAGSCSKASSCGTSAKQSAKTSEEK